MLVRALSVLPKESAALPLSILQIMNVVNCWDVMLQSVNNILYHIKSIIHVMQPRIAWNIQRYVHANYSSNYALTLSFVTYATIREKKVKE